jgi:hypothetical protein
MSQYVLLIEKDGNIVEKNIKTILLDKLYSICGYRTDKDFEKLHQLDVYELYGKKSGKKDKKFLCQICEKVFHTNAGLWKHKQKCLIEEKSDDENKNTKLNDTSQNNIIMMLIKKNDELQNMMMKVLENGTHNTTNNTNSHNKAFNLNFFLNETCKDAMNIMDFVDSIKLQLSDLERVGELGYVEGISSIIVKNLKELDVTQRPIHCTDKKRETIYIKDENQWEKDDERKKMHKLVRKVADKNARMIPKYKEVHPDYGKSTSTCSDQYNKIIVESFGNDYEKEEKIIKKVTKEVIVDK